MILRNTGRGNLPTVRAMLPEAAVFVCQDDGSGRVCGFIGLTGGEFFA